MRVLLLSSLNLSSALKYALRDLCAGSVIKVRRIFVSVLGRMLDVGVTSLGKPCVAIVCLSLFPSKLRDLVLLKRSANMFAYAV